MARNKEEELRALPFAEPKMKQILDCYAKEMITDDQIERVLEPVYRMINEGKFDRQQTGRATAHHGDQDGHRN